MKVIDFRYCNKKIFRNKLCIFLLFCILPFYSVYAENKAKNDKKIQKKNYENYHNWKKELKQKITEKINRSKFSKKDLGIWIGNFLLEEEIFSLNDNKQFIPASLTKLITALASFESFPIGHRFKTYLMSNGLLEDNVLKGDLVITGEGDPSFVSESMWNLVNRFYRTGIKKIEGNIVVDVSHYDNKKIPDGRQNVNTDRSYNAPISGITFNWNTVNVYIRPGKINKKADIYFDPSNNYIKLNNYVKTVKRGKNKIYFSRKMNNSGKENYVIKGQINYKSKELVYYKNILDPIRWVGENLISFLKRRGITVSGEIVEGKADNLKILAQHEGKTISQIIYDMQKFSNNTIAEMLTKNLSLLDGSIGKMKEGIDVIKDFLTGKINFNEKEFILKSPSGFSRKNKFTPKQIAGILNYINKNYIIQSEFIASLPRAGIDGTLKSRLENCKGWIRAKTGYLRGVVGLAGYAGRKDGETITFVFIYNGPDKNDFSVRIFFDSLANILIEN